MGSALAANSASIVIPAFFGYIIFCTEILETLETLPFNSFYLRAFQLSQLSQLSHAIFACQFCQFCQFHHFFTSKLPLFPLKLTILSILTKHFFCIALPPGSPKICLQRLMIACPFFIYSLYIPYPFPTLLPTFYELFTNFLRDFSDHILDLSRVNLDPISRLFRDFFRGSFIGAPEKFVRIFWGEWRPESPVDLAKLGPQRAVSTLATRYRTRKKCYFNDVFLKKMSEKFVHIRKLLYLCSRLTVI